MKITKIYDYWLLESDGYLTENEEKTIEERLFFKTIRVREENINSIREATSEEIEA
jgi:hypothetical protein